ncbi:hypothetical protein [Algoriphagus sp. A40]|uniref:hypothetical protein n=1 Tax=Algoriphagus sp. A40 TaxID=1945863 RepID=UPI000984C38D|nr:hypothetical protein [Algoriphagus sp. A40]OOG78293.1 hypothetical protein B0E43_02515 [Algoriphagus sp. A40]
MSSIKDSVSLPEETLTKEEFDRLTFSAGVSMVFDPAEKLYKVTFNERCWEEVYDPVWKGECVTNSEKQIEFLVELWYRLNPDGSWTCIKGKRESIQVFIVSSEYCKKEREFVLSKLTETRILTEPKFYQRFNFENGDSVWKSVP